MSIAAYGRRQDNYGKGKESPSFQSEFYAYCIKFTSENSKNRQITQNLLTKRYGNVRIFAKKIFSENYFVMKSDETEHKKCSITYLKQIRLAFKFHLALGRIAYESIKFWLIKY